jgi:hypothetical protein
VLVTSLTVVNTLILVALCVILLKFKRSIPDIQQVLSDVGSSISEQLKEIFSDAPVKKAMGILGKHSGEARADNALRTKAADAIMGQFPGLQMVLDQFGLSPIEGVKLMNDPLFGPLIMKGLGAAKSALSKGIGGGGGSSYSSGGSNSDTFKVT